MESEKNVQFRVEEQGPKEEEVTIKSKSGEQQMAAEEENGWIAAAAACDDGKGLILSEIDPDDKEDMVFVCGVLQVNDRFAKTRLTRYIRRLREQRFLPQQQQEAEEGDPFKTPSQPPKKKHKTGSSGPDSPGTLIDEGNSDDSDFLAKVVEAISSRCQITVPGDPFCVPEKLGPFAKIKLLHTNGNIDCRFRQQPTPVGQELIQNLTTAQSADTIILLGKSGVGKTTAIFDAATSSGLWCLYFSASEYKWDMQKRDPGQYDKSYSMMVDEMRSINDNSEGVKEDKCYHIIKAMLLSRFLVMEKFRKLPGATPEKWMRYQLTDEMHEATTTAFSYLKKYERRDKVKVLAARARKQLVEDECKWFFAYDECQFGYEILKGKCASWKSTTTGELRGVSCPLLRIMGEAKTVIAGTALSMKTADSCLSDIGRTSTTEVLTDFPPVNLEEIHSELRKNLNLDGVDLDRVPLWKLEGRGRLLGGLLPTLVKVVQEFRYTHSEKEKLLETAINDHFRRFLDSIVENIKKSFKLGKYGDQRNDILSVKQDLPRSLEVLALAAHWGGTFAIGKDNIDIDLLDIGLCSVRVEHFERDAKLSEKTVYVLDEELGREAILEVAREYNFPKTSFGTTVQLSQEGKGHAVEPVLVAELARWSREHPCATVRLFLETLFQKDKLPQNLPDWINGALFNVKNTRKSKGRKDIKFIADALKTDGDLRDVLLSPSTVKRPDFEGVMGKGSVGCVEIEQGSKCSPWFLAVSSKLYQKTYHDRYCEDLRSTDPLKGFYRKKDGDENLNCINLLKDWKVVLNHNRDVFRRCLRLHFCLPDVSTNRALKNERIWVEDDGSIVAYITEENVRKIFSEGVMTILEGLGAVKKLLAIEE